MPLTVTLINPTNSASVVVSAMPRFKSAVSSVGMYEVALFLVMRINVDAGNVMPWRVPVLAVPVMAI